MFDSLKKPPSQRDARCPICANKVKGLHVFEGEGFPTLREIADAWVGLGRPAALDLSMELFKYQSDAVWPNPDTLDDDDPVKQILGISVRAHEGVGFWMRPASVEYERVHCMNCQKPFPRAVPKDAIPYGAVVRCPKCEIQNQETPRETHLREFLGFLTTREGTLSIGAGHEVDADAMEAGVRAFMAAKGAPLKEREEDGNKGS